MPGLVVIVNADGQILRQTEAALSESGYSVTALSSYREAAKLLESVTPDLLVTDICLGLFNGLQLAIYSRFDHPAVPVIVTHVQADPIFEAEAKRHGAEFLVASRDDAALVSRIESTMRERSREQSKVRRWSRKQVPSSLRVRVADAQARVIDMSYGGVSSGVAATIPLAALSTPPSRAPRFDLRVPVRYRAFGYDDWHAGSSENMSRTGLLFRADRLLPVNTRIEVLVTLPIGPGGSEIRCRGRVVRAVPSAAPYSLPALATTIFTYQFLRGSGSPA